MSAFSVPSSEEFNEAVRDAVPDNNTTGTEINWETDENPFYGRFRGLQGSLQKEVETRRALEGRLSQMEAMLVTTSMADLPEEERQMRMQAYVAQQEMNRRAQTIKAREEDIERASKVAYIQMLSQKYGVPQDKLMRFSNPDDMETYAKDVFEERKKGRKQGKSESRDDAADRFEGGGTTAKKPKQKFTSIEEAAAHFAKLPDPRTRR